MDLRTVISDLGEFITILKNKIKTGKELTVFEELYVSIVEQRYNIGRWQPAMESLVDTVTECTQAMDLFAQEFEECTQAVTLLHEALAKGG